jgi:CelD/BcsL family acetyltransferase involved in cellulose biosynthesis
MNAAKTSNKKARKYAAKVKRFFDEFGPVSKSDPKLYVEHNQK